MCFCPAIFWFISFFYSTQYFFTYALSNYFSQATNQSNNATNNVTTLVANLESRDFTVHENDKMICYHCKKKYNLSTIWNHLRHDCKENFAISVEHRKEYMARNNERAKKHQAKYRKKVDNASYSKNSFHRAELFPKRDRFVGKFSHFLMKESPFFIAMGVEDWFLLTMDQEPPRETFCRNILLNYRKLSLFICVVTKVIVMLLTIVCYFVDFRDRSRKVIS